MKLKNRVSRISRMTIALFIITAFLLPSFSLITMVAAEEQTYQNITIDTANYMIEHENKYPNLVILDVRDTIEYNLGHLYNAILIPLNDLEARIGELEDYKTSEIIIYCKSGYRSQQASEFLGEYGFTKIYNMIGGILAWIDADYPIWTTSHHITVDEITDTKFELLIEPQLLYYSGCYSCNENYECPSQSESISVTSEILEQGEDHITILNRYEINDIVYEIIYTHTLLWSYNNFRSVINKTAYFFSTEITYDNYYSQSYRLYHLVQHNNYDLTTVTQLDPLNSETYNNSYTYIRYVPVNGNPITSMEIVQFNMPVLLSQQFDILADIAEEMAEIYKKSEDLDLMELYYGYTNMGEGIRSLSELVKEQLGEYDWQILESYTTLMDYIVNGGNGGDPPPPPPPVGCFGGDPHWNCFWCEVICMSAIVVGCFIACAAYFPSCPYCIYIMYYVEVLHFSCRAACVLFGCC